MPCTDLHRSKLTQLPRFLLADIFFFKREYCKTIENAFTASSLTGLLYFYFEITFVLHNRRGAQDAATTAYPSAVFHNNHLVTYGHGKRFLLNNNKYEAVATARRVQVPIRLVSKHIGLASGNETCSVYLMPSKHLLKHDSTVDIEKFLIDQYAERPMVDIILFLRLKKKLKSAVIILNRRPASVHQL